MLNPRNSAVQEPRETGKRGGGRGGKGRKGGKHRVMRHKKAEEEGGGRQRMAQGKRKEGAEKHRAMR